jgi:hypothetical protein
MTSWQIMTSTLRYGAMTASNISLHAVQGQETPSSPEFIDIQAVQVLREDKTIERIPWPSRGLQA